MSHVCAVGGLRPVIRSGDQAWTRADMSLSMRPRE